MNVTPVLLKRWGNLIHNPVSGRTSSSDAWSTGSFQGVGTGVS